MSALLSTGGVAAGAVHSVVLRSDGTVWTFGGNSYGQLGDGTTFGHSTPASVAGLSGVTAIAAGGSLTLALKADGTVWAFGRTSTARSGMARRRIACCRWPLTGLSNVSAIAAGSEHALALKADGSLWAWGLNSTWGSWEMAPRSSGRHRCRWPVWVRLWRSRPALPIRSRS